MILPFDPAPFGAACSELDRWATRIDERIVPHRWEGRLRRALEAEAIAASTRMEGVAVTVADVLKIVADDPPEAVSSADRALVLGYRDAMRFVQRRADDGNLAWNRELIVGVQDRVLAGDRGAGAGQLRGRAVWVSGSDGTVVFETAEHERVPGLVDAACAQVDERGAHPAVAAAWLHVAIAAIHPFQDGNGRTARVLASLAMYRGGFRHPAFTSLEEWWGRHPGDYYGAFSCLGRSFDERVDVTPFVETHVRAQVAQVRELAVRQQRDGLLWTALENLLDELTLPPRLANALYDSVFGRDVTTGYYRDLADTSPATARNDLAAARAAGLLASEGRTRGRRYLAGPRLLPLLARAVGAPEPTEQAIVATLARIAATETRAP